MTDKRLGRGISALIPEYPYGMELVYKVAEIEVEKIKSNPHQPRKQFNEQRMSELVRSIRENGIIQPVTVRQVDEGFEIIAGERRLKASYELGLKTIPAYVLPVESDEGMMEISLVENLQREDLNPIEEAEAFRVLSNFFNLSHEEIAEKVGKDRSTITNTLRLLNLPEAIQKDLKSGELTPGHARPLLSLSGEKQQMNMWMRIKRESLSVRAVESLVKKRESKSIPLSYERKPTKSQFILSTEERLMHILGTRVRIKGKDAKGLIEVEFYTKEDLNRLLEMFESIEESWK